MEKRRDGLDGSEEWSRYVDAPAWPWLAAGIVLVALLLGVLVTAWNNP